MGEALLDAPHVEQMFSVAKRILGYDLLDICLNGPKETLDKTEYCQPAVFVTSLGALEMLRSERREAVTNCCGTAGFSIGEFAALVFAGCLTFEDALRLVKIRAEAMQLCSQQVPSGLMTIFYGADGKVNFACRAASEWCTRRGIEPEHSVCGVTNYLFPHCKVIGGHEEALKFIELNAKDFGIKKTKRLAVSGAFHTSLMKPAEEVLKEALKKVQIQRPLIPVYSNIDGKPYKNELQVREKLGKQLTSPVKWEQTMHVIYSRDQDVDFPQSFECGPGTTLMSILAMTNGKARKTAIHVKV
jgi:[acyl-carrier-protein] S-malonyltransferase